MDNATERAGMLFVQVERFMRVLASVVQQVNFYLYATTCRTMLCKKNDSISLLVFFKKNDTFLNLETV